jgi:hypothetical protein
VGFYLIAATLNGEDPEQVLSEIRAFASSRVAVAEQYRPMAGFFLEKAIALKPDMDLIPWQDVPDGPQKQRFNRSFSYSAYAYAPFFHFPVLPTAALRTRGPCHQVLFASHDEALKIDLEQLSRLGECARDLERCITCLTASPVAILADWEQSDNKIANGMSGQGYSYGKLLFDSVLERACPMLDAPSIADLYSRFEKFKEKPPIRVALDRLSSALREPVLASNRSRNSS